VLGAAGAWRIGLACTVKGDTTGKPDAVLDSAERLGSVEDALPRTR